MMRTTAGAVGDTRCGAIGCFAADSVVASGRATGESYAKVAEVWSLKVDVITGVFVGRLSCRDRVSPAGHGYSRPMRCRPEEVVLARSAGLAVVAVGRDDVDAFGLPL